MILKHALYLALLLAGSGRVFAQTPAPGDDLDDPKLARRLKTRVTLPVSGAAADKPSPFAPVDVLAVTPSLPPDSPPPTGAPPPAVASPPPAWPAPTSTSAGAPEATLSESPPRARESEHDRDKGRTPILQLGYRRFSFVQIGAVSPGSTSGAPAAEPFDSLSIDFYPISRLVRFGMSTQYGWQGGTFNSGSGDYFVAQSFSLGIQHAGPTVTPFAEALGGAGYMRRFQFDRTVPTAYWQFGIDAGAAFFLADHAFVSAAIGYLHAVNGFAEQQSFATVYLDTWSFKLGIGI